MASAMRKTHESNTARVGKLGTRQGEEKNAGFLAFLRRLPCVAHWRYLDQ